VIKAPVSFRLFIINLEFGGNDFAGTTFVS
jgi:hypothetical protein